MFLPIMICCWKKINKKGRNSFVPNLQHFQFGLDVWKSKTFFLKIIWIWTCSEIFKKFRYGEDLLLFWMMSNIASGHLFTLSNNIYTRKSSLRNIDLFQLNIRNTKKVWKMFKVNKTSERLSTVFFVSFRCFLHLFYLFCCWLWTKRN